MTTQAEVTPEVKQKQLQQILDIFRADGYDIKHDPEPEENYAEEIWYVSKPDWEFKGSSLDIAWVDEPDWTGWQINPWLYGDLETLIPEFREKLRVLDFPINYGLKAVGEEPGLD